MNSRQQTRCGGFGAKWALLIILTLLAIAGCGPNPAPAMSPVAGMDESSSASLGTDTGAEPNPAASAVPGAAASPTSGAPAAGQVVLDVFNARMPVEAGGGVSLSADPFLNGLSFWDSHGQQVSASKLLAAAVLEGASSGVRKARWSVAMGDSGGVVLSVVGEQVTEGTLSVVVTATQRSGVSAMGVCMPARPDEHFYGLGERFGHFDLVGQVIQNLTAEKAGLRTSYSPATFLLSGRGYGLYLETMADAVFDLRTAGRGCYWVRAGGPELRFDFFAGPHPQTVIERHARFVGLPPLPPQWAVGVWKNLIGGQARVMQDLQKLRDEGVPLDAVWIYDAVVERADFGWPWQIYGPIPPGPYPDLPGMIGQLHGMNLKVLGYLNPFLYPGWQGYSEAQQKGYLVQTSGGQPYLQPWTFGQRAHLDFTNPEATRWWQSRVDYALTEVGFDGAMLDFGEDAPTDGRYAGVSAGYLMDNMYPLLYHRAAFEAGQAAKPGDFVFFARSGYSGDQHYTTGRFTGDQVRSWDAKLGLPSVVPAVLNGSLSGWPYWGPDIAGFFPGAVQGPGEKELWIRWVEVGAMMPAMRDMDGAMDKPINLWTDGETLAVFRTYAKLHTAIKPYLYRYAGIAHDQGLPIVRPLFLNYPGEAETYSLEDQYLLGDDLLVAPVLKPGQTDRSVYLPGDRWQYYWTGEVYQGPVQVTVQAPVGHVPLFIRQGANLGLPAPGQ